MNAILETQPMPRNASLRETVEEACRRIPPLWPLRNFVAVNPFVGLTGRPFPQAARLMQQVGHGETLMSAQFYLDRIAGGRIRERDVAAALEGTGETLPPPRRQGAEGTLLSRLRESLEQPAEPPGDALLTFAEYADRRLGRDWAGFIVEEVSKWCSAYFDQGQSSWRMPWRGLGLFDAWRAAARLDANPELMGMGGFRPFAAGLSGDPMEVIERAVATLGVPEPVQGDFLHRQLMTLRGWSGYIQCGVRARGMEGRGDDALVQFLAIRLAYDLGLRRELEGEAELLAGWERELRRARSDSPSSCPHLTARFLAQQALECAYQRTVAGWLQSRPEATAAPHPPALQAVFCIDVRSEVFRRALESQSNEIETIGFAGFFGAAIEYERLGQAATSALCPVLLLPRHRIRESLRTPDEEAAFLRSLEFRRTLNGAWNAFKTSAISCFSFVETSGLWFGVKLARASLALAAPDAGPAGAAAKAGRGPRIEHETDRPHGHHHGTATGMALSDQIEMAAGALRHMGLAGGDFARVVLLCGHGSTTTNNPYGSALDCGACGGHAGDVNARVTAAILNHPAVREGLALRGIQVPPETLFIAGLHDTTTDDVMLHEGDGVPAAHQADLRRIKGWLSGASRRARMERAASLGLDPLEGTALDRAVRARSRDWSQVRPEWGLAGNAAFIAAPRERTKGLNLGGRVFLHNYHANRDKDNATLELILTAPMVVASWINLQYYGSTVDNRLFGSGNKVLHNVVGTFGVWQGNGGDLQTGLPLQSIHDGKRLVHEPLRLSVFIEARREHIDAVLRAHAPVRQLVENGWVHLFSIDPADGTVWRCQGPSLWRPFAA
jgi:hypothetical protein